MENVFPGNKVAQENIEHYLNRKSPGCLILRGPKGCGKEKAAKYIASSLLRCNPDDLLLNPDFYYISKNGETIKVEDIMALLTRSRISSVGSYKVFIILESNITIQGQNRLLKLLEDGNATNIIIFTCSKDGLINTIKSRCQIIDFYRLSNKDMTCYLQTCGVKEKDINLVSFICGNCPYQFDFIKDDLAYLLDLYEKIIGARERNTFLHLLSMIKEKDVSSFYETIHHKSTGILFFSFIFHRLLCHQLNLVISEDMCKLEKLYNISETYTIMNEITEHKRIYSKSYTRNDFFDLIRSIVSVNQNNI